MAADFWVAITIDDVDTKEFDNIVVEAGRKKEVSDEVLVPHDSQWSFEWKASDPNGTYAPVEDSLPDEGSKTVSCPPDDVFDPGVSVVFDCSEQKHPPSPYAVTVNLANSESTMDVDFEVTSTVN